MTEPREAFGVFNGSFAKRWRCRVVEAPPTFWRQRPRWTYIVESHWVIWTDESPFYRAPKFYSHESAVEGANRFLDRIENRQRGDYV